MTENFPDPFSNRKWLVNSLRQGFTEIYGNEVNMKGLWAMAQQVDMGVCAHTIEGIVLF